MKMAGLLFLFKWLYRLVENVRTDNDITQTGY